MERPQEEPSSNNEQEPTIEKMVEATKISTVFSDQKVLEQIADDLLSRGMISGFHIDRTLSGYIHKGKKLEENQYSLEILLDDQTDGKVKEEIRRTIETTIGKKWDVPAIEEEPVRVNKGLLEFVRRAGIEHSRYVRERRLKLVIALSALMSVSATLGTFTKKYFDEREKKAVATERAESYRRISDLEKKVSNQIFALDAQIASGKPLTVTPSDMSSQTDYDETGKILDTVREVQFEMHKLGEASEAK